MTSHSFAKGANEWGTRLELSVFRWEGAPAITAGALPPNVLIVRIGGQVVIAVTELLPTLLPKAGDKGGAPEVKIHGERLGHPPGRIAESIGQEPGGLPTL